MYKFLQGLIIAVGVIIMAVANSCFILSLYYDLKGILGYLGVPYPDFKICLAHGLENHLGL